MVKSIYVGNLPFTASDSDVRDQFAQYGDVQSVNLIMDRETGRPRGFAFVTMGSPEEAQKAIEAMNGATLDGRQLTVNEARPQEERPSGGGGRGGFRGGREGGGNRGGGGGGGYGRR